MTWPAAKPSLVVIITLFGCAFAVCGWQFIEHRRIEQVAAAALINRGRDITSTLGVVVRSQRRFGMLISKERTEAAIQDLIRPGEVESVAILGATGETIASAGRPVDLTPDQLRERAVSWRTHTLVLMNLMDLGVASSEDGSHPRPPIVVVDEELSRAFRNQRRPPDSANPPATAPAATSSDKPAESNPAASSATPDSPPPRPPRPRAPYGRPSWMKPEEYDAVIQKQGVHSLVVALSTDEMHRVVRSDLLLRALVSVLTVAAATISVLAWRNLAKTADLQIRLIKAGEMNTHLKEMNLAAAGLAHETRNPLNLIRGFAQMIAIEDAHNPKLKAHASTIMEEADRVTAQLNEFINYSKPREAQFSSVDVSRVGADLARTLLPDTEEKKVQIHVPETPVYVEADEQLLRQALFNLFLNAVQSVEPSGKIYLAVTSVIGTGEAVLEVRDDGPGVPAAQRQAIFNPYVTMRPKGVGLGLAIVQQIISAHRWVISCEANQPRGAIFRISRVKLAPAPNSGPNS